jgi:hypothetical protein
LPPSKLHWYDMGSPGVFTKFGPSCDLYCNNIVDAIQRGRILLLVHYCNKQECFETSVIHISGIFYYTYTILLLFVNMNF